MIRYRFVPTCPNPEAVTVWCDASGFFMSKSFVISLPKGIFVWLRAKRFAARCINVNVIVGNVQAERKALIPDCCVLSAQGDFTIFIGYASGDSICSP